MYAAGASAVIDWLYGKVAQMSETTIMSPDDETEMPDSYEGNLRRLMKGSVL